MDWNITAFGEAKKEEKLKPLLCSDEDDLAVLAEDRKSQSQSGAECYRGSAVIGLSLVDLFYSVE